MSCWSQILQNINVNLLLVLVNDISFNSLGPHESRVEGCQGLWALLHVRIEACLRLVENILRDSTDGLLRLVELPDFKLQSNHKLLKLLLPHSQLPLTILDHCSLLRTKFIILLKTLIGHLRQPVIIVPIQRPLLTKIRKKV